MAADTQAEKRLGSSQFIFEGAAWAGAACLSSFSPPPPPPSKSATFFECLSDSVISPLKPSRFHSLRGRSSVRNQPRCPGNRPPCAIAFRSRPDRGSRAEPARESPRTTLLRGLAERTRCSSGARVSKRANSRSVALPPRTAKREAAGSGAVGTEAARRFGAVRGRTGKRRWLCASRFFTSPRIRVGRLLNSSPRSDLNTPRPRRRELPATLESWTACGASSAPLRSFR